MAGRLGLDEPCSPLLSLRSLDGQKPRNKTNCAWLKPIPSPQAHTKNASIRSARVSVRIHHSAIHINTYVRFERRIPDGQVSQRSCVLVLWCVLITKKHLSSRARNDQMGVIRTVAHKVFRCFWRIERCADRLTGKVGPFFIAIAVLLITMAIVTYFDVIFPMAFLQPECDPLMSVLSLIFSVYLSACSMIHYYFACTTAPGSPSEPINQPNKSFSLGRSSCARGLRRWLPRGQRIGPVKQEMIEQYRANINRHCLKCLKNGIKGVDGRGPIKPERAHHCRVCGVCQLKYDHHCPWINQCVGLRNERFFLLFLFYMTVSCAWVVFWGWPSFTESLDFSTSWPFWSPRIFVILTWVLALAIGVTIGIMFGWQLLLIAKGETTVESSDNEYYHQLFSQRGQKYVNPFDLGVRGNLEQFFNTGRGGRCGWYTVLLPLKFPPSNDGWSWPKRAGWENQVINLAEELTDEEDDEDDHPTPL